jgi:hypothetical protein
MTFSGTLPSAARNSESVPQRVNPGFLHDVLDDLPARRAGAVPNALADQAS